LALEIEGACICVRIGAKDVDNRNIVVGRGGEDQNDEGERNIQGGNDGENEIVQDINLSYFIHSFTWRWRKGFDIATSRRTTLRKNVAGYSSADT
jgi:hypothetical protein